MVLHYEMTADHYYVIFPTAIYTASIIHYTLSAQNVNSVSTITVPTCLYDSVRQISAAATPQNLSSYKTLRLKALIMVMI